MRGWEVWPHLPHLCSISQRLACLQNVLDPRQRSGRFHQCHEGLALQRQQVALAQFVDRIGRAARQHMREAAGDDDVVIGRDAALVETVGRHRHADATRRARQADRLRLRHVIVDGERQRLGLGVGKQPVAVHGDPVVLAQDHHLLRLRGGFGDRCGRYHLEHLGRRRHRAFRQFRRALPARQHLLAAAPAGDEADAAFDEAGVELGMRLHGIGMQQHLAAAAERHAGRRSDDGKRRVFQRLVGGLAGEDQLLDLTPGGDVGGKQSQAEIGADGEMRPLVVDDERLVAGLDQFHRPAQQVHDLLIERIALAGEFEAEHTIADVPHRRRGVLQQRLAGELDVLQQYHAVRPDDVVVGAVEPEILPAAALDTVEGLVTNLHEKGWDLDAVGL